MIKMMQIGLMKEGSTCSTCNEDIGGKTGVVVNGYDYCKKCGKYFINTAY